MRNSGGAITRPMALGGVGNGNANMRISYAFLSLLWNIRKNRN